MMSMPFRAPIDWRILRDAADLRYQVWRIDRDRRHREMGARIKVELYPEPDAPERPTVVVGQRVAVGEQQPPACASLVRLASDNGWEARATYALVVAKGKMIETCVCWLRRGRQRGHAGWQRTDGGPWAFVSAWIGLQRYGWQRGKDWPADRYTIREILAQ